MQAFKIMGLLSLAAALGIIALIIVTVAPSITVPPFQPMVTSFEECVAAGNPVMESYPRQCRSADGQHFVEDISTQDPYVDPYFDPNQTGGGLGLQANGCAVAGCSGQLCVSADEAGNIMTTCEYRAEYGCYQEASCEPQADGQCGWTETPELQQCLANPPSLESEMYLEVM